MHYADGTEVKPYDLCQGKGYNVKHEVQGIVVGMKPEATSCNLTILRLRPYQLGAELGGLGDPMLDHEYGQADAFRLLQRADGSLPT